MKSVQLLPMGSIEEEILVTIASAVGRTYEINVDRLDAVDVPAYAFDSHRRQYNSELVLRSLVRGVSDDAYRILAVVDVDLFIPMLTFVFGQAQLKGKAAVVSSARLHQEFYGLPQNRESMLRRITKESVHELGHTFGLTHCGDPACLMSVAISITQIDAKGEELCDDCSLLLNHLFPKYQKT